MAFVNIRKNDGKSLTIDSERNLVLEYLGGGRPQEPLNFNFNIDGENIKFSAFRKTTRLESGKNHIEWRVVQIIAPPHLKTGTTKFHTLIEEALNGYGFSASRERVETLSVTFAPNL